MAGGLSAMSNRSIQFALVLALSLGVAHAERLPDPTEPPASLDLKAVAQAAPRAEPVLQAVQREGMRFYALVDGRSVRVGDRVGDATVVQITPNEVVLREGSANKKLKLLPDSSVHAIVKTPAASAKSQPKAN